MIEKKIKSELEKRGISLYRLSKLSNIRYELLRRSFNESRKLSADELITIAKCTNLPLEALTK